MRFSLREFFVLTTFVAGATPLLMFATPHTRGVTIAVTALIGFLFVVRSLVERGRRQATAIGFVAVAGCYTAMILFASSGKEVNPYTSRIPTIQVLQLPLTWMQQARGDEPPPKTTDPTLWSPYLQAQRNRQAHPTVTNFTTTAHCLWTLLFGYLGGKYASHVYARRVKREQEAAANPREP